MLSSAKLGKPMLFEWLTFDSISDTERCRWSAWCEEMSVWRDGGILSVLQLVVGVVWHDMVEKFADNLGLFYLRYSLTKMTQGISLPGNFGIDRISFKFLPQCIHALVSIRTSSCRSYSFMWTLNFHRSAIEICMWEISSVVLWHGYLLTLQTSGLISRSFGVHF